MKQMLAISFFLFLSAAIAKGEGLSCAVLQDNDTSCSITDTIAGCRYVRNNQGSYERYGIVESVTSLSAASSYEGKYVLWGNEIFVFSNGKWNRTVIVVKEATIPSDGIYVVDGGGNFFSLDEWEIQEHVVSSGIAVVANGAGLVIAPNLIPQASIMRLSAKSSNISLYPDSEIAALNNSGYDNTYHLHDCLGECANAASVCLKYLFECGTKGYLISAGEAKEYIIDHIDDLRNAFTRAFGLDIMSSPIATSTMKTATDVWEISFDGSYKGQLKPNDISSPCVVLPVSPLPRQQFKYPYSMVPDIQNETDSIIHFADEFAKEVCISNYDTNGDGELSLNEASEVSDIDYDFGGKLMESFDELIYFTKIKNIYGQSFSGCPNLFSITLPSNVSVIWSASFYNCPKLRYINVDVASKYLCSVDGVLYNQAKTTLFKCPQAFEGELVMPSEVTYIEPYALYNCKDLTSLEFSSHVASIGDYAFQGCSGLSNVKVHWSEPIEFNTNLFSGVNLTSATLHVPSGSSSLYRSSKTWGRFGHIVEYEDHTTNKLHISDDEVNRVLLSHFDADKDGSISYDEALAVTSLDGIFRGNHLVKSFREMAYFTGLSVVGDNEFEGCRSLTDISLPASIKRIGTAAFRGCESLSKLTIPSGVTSIGLNAFDGTKRLSNISVATGNRYFMSEKGILYNRSRTTLIKYPQAINNASFQLPSTVQFISDAALKDASNLEQLTLPVALKSIGSLAFKNCRLLQSVKIPQAVTSIGEYCFAGCESLATIDIPESITKIPNGAFCGCMNLHTVNGTADFSDIGGNAFADTDISSLPFANSVTSIGDYAFTRCDSLQILRLPDGLEEIGNSAFADCSLLCSVKLPSTVSSIGHRAFANDKLNELLSNIDKPISISSETFSHYEDCRLYTKKSNVMEYSQADIWRDFGNHIGLTNGDVNLDGRVDVSDVVVVANQILGQDIHLDNIFLSYPELLDMNEDGMVSVADIVEITNMILN